MIISPYVHLAIEVKLLRGELPQYHTEGAAALDLRWQPDHDDPKHYRLITNGEVSNNLISVVYADRPRRLETGISVVVPPNHVGLILPRSGLTSMGIVAQVGVIDPDYRGELEVTLINTTGSAQRIEAGQRIAQFLIVPAPRLTLVQVDDLPPTARGQAGHGSTGCK